MIECPATLTQEGLEFIERETLRIIFGAGQQFLVFGHIVTICSYRFNCQENISASARYQEEGEGGVLAHGAKGRGQRAERKEGRDRGRRSEDRGRRTEDG